MSIQELKDAGSALYAPTIPDQEDFVETLESDCGFLLGHLLGFIRKAFGISPIEELVKPLVGDWTAMQKAEGGWVQLGEMCDGVGENFGGLNDQTQQPWQGTAGDAFRSRMDSLKTNYTTYGDGCRTLSSLSSALVSGAQAAAQGIALLISFIADLVERLVVEASVPVIGWLVGAADVVINIKKFWDKINKGYKLIKKFLDIIQKFVGVLEKVNKVLASLRTALAAMETLVQSATASHAPRAAENQFGA